MNNTQTTDQKKQELEGLAMVCYLGACFYPKFENIYTYIYTHEKNDEDSPISSPTLGLPEQGHKNFHGFTMPCRVSYWMLLSSNLLLLRAHARDVVVLAAPGETLSSGLDRKNTLFILLRTRGLITPYIQGLIAQLI